ncbi:MAG: FAD-dependent oxidoreductase [Syntrophobacter sp.]
MAKQILVIGGSAAGMRSASRARRKDQGIQITVLERDSDISYAACGIPFYIHGETGIRELTSSPIGIQRSPEFFKNVKDIDVHIRTLATKIDRGSKTVEAIHLDTRETVVYPYDQLVLGLGATPIVPPVPGIDLMGVSCCRNLEDAASIIECMGTSGKREAVIIGGGLIGLELLEPLLSNGFGVSVIEAKSHLASSILDFDMSELIEDYLPGKGVRLYLGEKVCRLSGNDGRVEKVITDKRVLPASLVIVSAGIRPNVLLARDAGLAMGSLGGITVNEFMQTSDPDIYAAGDCVETHDILTGRKVLCPMGSVANKQGRVIGDNLTGGRTAFTGVARTAVARVFDVNVGRTGLGEEEARRLGYEVEISINPNIDKPHYQKTVKHFIMKFIADRNTRRLLGMQAVGGGELVKRIDVTATALFCGATVDLVADIDLGYAPPFSAAIDNVTETANMMRNKFDGLAETIHPSVVKEKLDRGDDFILVDIRPDFEKKMEEARIPDQWVDIPWIKRIPLWDLRKRLDELDRDQEIVIFCRGGVRTFEAYRIMKGAGFNRVYILDGSTDFWPQIFVYCRNVYEQRSGRAIASAVQA